MRLGMSLFSSWPHILLFYTPQSPLDAQRPSSRSSLICCGVNEDTLSCLRLSPEPYQYSWVCRVRLCDGCLISLWSPRARPFGALRRQQQSSVWSAERTSARIDLHILSLPSICTSTRTQMQPTGTWIHASTVGPAWHVTLKVSSWHALTLTDSSCTGFF